MAEDRPLPAPPKSPFGRRVPDSAAENPLVMERIEQAMAEGRLDEFLDREFGGDGQQRKMTELMMGFMGMGPGSPGEASTPPPISPGPERERAPSPDTTEPEPAQTMSVPPEVIAAAGRADVASLIKILSRERDKRSGLEDDVGTEPGQAETGGLHQQDQQTAASHFDRPTLDALVSMARENGVSIDWLMSRAVKLYVMEYGKTGRL